MLDLAGLQVHVSNTPKILIWIFIKIFIWFKGGYLNIFFRGTLLLKIFYEINLKGPSQPWCLVLRVFQNCVGSTQIILEGFAIISIKKKSYGLLVFILLPFKDFSFALSHIEIFFPNPSIHFGSSQISNPSKFNPFFIFILFILSSKQFLSFILDLVDLQRNHQIPFEFCSQTNSPG